MTDTSIRDEMISEIPLQRMGTRTEIAEACLYLASPLSSYMTGSVMVMDGGSWLTFTTPKSML